MGRFAAEVEDVRSLAAPTLRHRLVPSFRAEAEGVRPGDVVESVLQSVSP
jgi:MoxR-like ATPase